MKNKGKTLLRIVLYLILAYVPVYILCLAYSDKQGSVTSVLAGNTLMLYPAIAVIITRLVTREGFRDIYCLILHTAVHTLGGVSAYGAFRR